MRHLSLPSCFGGSLLALGIALTWQAGPLRGQTPKQAEPRKKAEEARKPARKRLVVDLSGFEMLDASKMRKERTAVGATRGFPQPEALAPKLAKLYGVGSLFEWVYTGKAKSFALVFSDDQEAEHFRTEASGAQFVYPATAPQFQPGKTYAWTVEVSPSMMGANPSEPAEFVVVSQGEREEIEKALAAIVGADPYQAGLARAKVFTDHRLWYDALGAYTDLIVRYPHRAEPYEQRGMIYSQLEVTQPLAEKDFSRADELQAK